MVLTRNFPRLNGDTVVGFTKPEGWPESDREQQCQNADEQIINLIFQLVNSSVS